MSDRHSQGTRGSNQLALLTFKIYSTTAPRTIEEALLYDDPQFKCKGIIGCPTALYLNHHTSSIAVLPLPEDNRRRHKYQEDGYRLLCEVYPHFTAAICTNFTITREAESDLGQQDFQESTYMLVSPELSGGKARLQSRDVVKFGKEKYLVHIGGMERVRWYDQVYFLPQRLQGTCRICLAEEGSHALDFLASPCRCTGSLAHVHITCLQQWIASQLTHHHTEGITSYCVRELLCEICKSNFPKFICTEGRMVELMPIGCGPHGVILEQIDFEQPQKLLICISRQEGETKTVVLGRGSESQVQLQDMSVSRKHAKLVIGPHGVDLLDCNSKYGTFVLLRREWTSLQAASVMSQRCRVDLALEDA